jgi:hypothetical protein
VQVFEAIRQAKPKQLFVAADGPRAGKEGEKERCEEARKIATAVDWDCEVKTLFREENIGCGRGPAEAITWFFEHVEQGIILEDDCLPAQSFFRFCEELLDRHSYEDKIQAISGTNLLTKWNRNNESYFYSINAGFWGWATWRRAWKKFDVAVPEWNDKTTRALFESFFTNLAHRDIYIKSLNEAFEKEGNVSWWDYQFIFSRIITSSFGIIPNINLVANLGFGNNATHTFDSNSELAKLPINEIEFPLNPPKALIIDWGYDSIYSSRFYPESSASSLQSKIKGRLRNIISK